MSKERQLGLENHGRVPVGSRLFVGPNTKEGKEDI